MVAVLVFSVPSFRWNEAQQLHILATLITKISILFLHNARLSTCKNNNKAIQALRVFLAVILYKRVEGTLGQSVILIRITWRCCVSSCFSWSVFFVFFGFKPSPVVFPKHLLLSSGSLMVYLNIVNVIIWFCRYCQQTFRFSFPPMAFSEPFLYKNVPFNVFLCHLVLKELKGKPPVGFQSVELDL